MAPLLRVVLLMVVALAANPVHAANNIDPLKQAAWSETSGWVSFAPTHGGIIIHTGSPAGYLSGFAWAENLGWIKLGQNGPYANSNATDWGVNLANNGALSGFAWSETGGWINFAPSHGGASLDPVTGYLSGDVWSENLGWIRLSNLGATAPYGVRKSSLPPVLAIHPSNQVKGVGTNATFTAAASGIPAPTVQWQVSTSGPGGPFSNLAGNATATTGSLTIPNLLAAQSGSAYRAVFTNLEASATSSPATLTVLTTGLEIWRQANFAISTNSDFAADSADPDGDGIANLMEFALNLMPNNPDISQLPVAAVENSYLTLKFRKPASATGISYHVQVSAALTGWSDLDLTTNTVATGTDADGTPTVTVRDDLLQSASPRRFMRLRITNP